jgi:chemotaxis protein MotB
VKDSGHRLRPEKKSSADGNSWLETYADTITLLMAFFVMMFSMSKLDEGKFKVLQQAISSEISKRPPRGKGPNAKTSFLPELNVLQNVPQPQQVPAEQRATASRTSADDLKAQPIIAELSEKGLMQLEYSPDGLKIEFASKALFPSGNADVKESMAAVLEEVGRVLAEGKFSKIDIEGHTDDVPIQTSRFPSNWELSASRATSVARALLALYPLDPQILRPSGFADTRPALPLDSEEAAGLELTEVRARNRRVVIHAQY